MAVTLFKKYTNDTNYHLTHQWLTPRINNNKLLELQNLQPTNQQPQVAVTNTRKTNITSPKIS